MPRKPNWKETYNRWADWDVVTPISYRCAYCGDKVSSERGHAFKDTRNGVLVGGVVVCPECKSPSFVYPETREIFPSPTFGTSVKHLPSEIEFLFEEARGCTGNNHFTAAVLLSRKLLMHIAVNVGAKPGLNFMEYVEFLSSAGYVPPNGKHWVHHIRKKGNEANHEIVMMKAEDARDLLSFSEMLLRFIYEFPNAIPKET